METVDQVGESVLGGPMRARVTPIGRILRQTRMDELPQIFNVLKGDICFIGPRPPLRVHVEACPRRYARVLGALRPGITGLSTVMVHQREERLLSRCGTSAEAEHVYRAHCLPLKLRLDVIYAEKRSFALDLLILWRTFARLRLRSGMRVAPMRNVPAAKPALSVEELPVAA